MALSKIKTGSLAADAVTSAAIADGAIVIADLADGSVTSAKLATLTTDVSFGDNAKVIFGAGGDLQIYHTGSASIISDQGTGNLQVLAGNLEINNSANSQNMITANGGGATSLFYAGSSKLATTNTGVDVTGTVTADGLTVDGDGTLQSATGSTLTLKSTDTSAGQNQLVGEIEFFNSDTSGDGGQVVGSLRTYTQGSTGYGGYIDVGTSTGLTGSEGADTVKRLRVDADGDISFYEDTGTTAKFFWDASAESLGIGNTIPSSFNTQARNLVIGDGVNRQGITIYSGATEQANIFFADGTGDPNYVMGGINYNHSNDSLSLRVNNSNRLTIDSSGNVGIGTSSPTTPIQLFSGSANGLAIAGATPLLTLVDTTDSSNYIFWAAQVNADTYLYNKSGAMILGTNNTEAMRIDSSGNLLVGRTSASTADEGAQIAPGGRLEATRAGAEPLRLNRKTSDGNIAVFRRENSNVGTIVVNSSGTTYNTTSDARLKTDIQPIPDATAKILAMNPVIHKWIADPEADAVHGFIAQEMQDVIPEAVSGDAESDEMMSMDYGRITPVIVAALQDALKEIKVLKQRINELEAK